MASSIRKPTSLDLSLLVLLAMIWGSAFLAIKVVVPETGPLWLATIRVAIAFVVLLPLALGRGMTLPKRPRQWRMMIIIMLLNVVIPFFLISWAEQYIDAGVTSLLMGVGPFIALIGSHFTTHDDKMTIAKISGAFFGFVGISILLGGNAFSGLGDDLLGQGAVILGAACYVTSGLMIRKLDSYSPICLSTLILGMSTLALLLLTLLFVGLPSQNFNQQSWMGLVYLGVFPTALGYLLRYYLIQAIGMTVFASSVNLIPVFGVLLSALLLGEVLSARLFVSLALIVTGLFIIRRNQGR